MTADPRSDTRRINEDYYATPSPGRLDYWRWMAAPRFRVKTFLRLLAERKPSRIVDLGCGGGELLDEVGARFPGAALAGIDFSDMQVNANRRRRPGMSWHVVDLDRDAAFPPDLAGRFQAVLASEIIEHLENPAVFLRNAARLAVPGAGVLLLSTQSGPVFETERHVGHVRHFTREEMTSLLRSTGWRPLRVWNAGFPFHDLSKWYANRNARESIRRFGTEAYSARQRAICWALRQAFRLNSNFRGKQLFAVAERESS